MNTYHHFAYKTRIRYWWEPNERCWYVENMNTPQEPCETYANKPSLLANYPEFKFKFSDYENLNFQITCFDLRDK